MAQDTVTAPALTRAQLIQASQDGARFTIRDLKRQANAALVALERDDSTGAAAWLDTVERTLAEAQAFVATWDQRRHS